MSNSHLIHRQILDVTFPSKKEAMDGQHQISRLYRRELLPLIKNVFDEVLPTNGHMRIERLEIDIGHVTFHNLKEDFRQGLRKKLEDQLLEKIQKARFHPHRHGDRDESVSDQSPTEERLIHMRGQSDIELFTYFVKTGQLPWWAHTEKFSLEELAKRILENQPERLHHLLLNLMSSTTYSRRIIQQFPNQILLKFIELKQLAKGIGKQIQDLHNELSRIHRQSPVVPLSQSNFRLLLWQAAFDFWLLNKLQPDSIPSDFQRQQADIPLPDNPIQVYLLFVVGLLADKGGISSTPEKERKQQSNELLIMQSLLKDMVYLGIQHRPLGKGLKALLDLSPSKLKKMMTALDADPVRKSPDTEYKKNDEKETGNLLQFEEATEIHNAGLVIIAPFLPRFFDSLGLVQDKSFLTEDAARRASLLLQYIATGENEAPEYELILNKILCDLPADEPLPRSLEVSERENVEVEKLLQSIVEHWEALKGTSIEGLRQTFIIKDGLLSRELSGWKLRVERTTVDVLLERLPWGISVIKLPWNDEIIYVEW